MEDRDVKSAGILRNDHLPGKAGQQTKDQNGLKKLSRLVRPMLETETFTHVFAACGKLSEEAPLFVLEQNSLHHCSHSKYAITGQESVFDLASLTKALVTAPLVFSQLQFGDELLESTDTLSLDMTVGRWLSGVKHKLSPSIQSITIRSLLRHNSGLPAWRNIWINRLGISAYPNLKSKHEIIETVLNRNSNQNPTKKYFLYSDLGYILLGYILEKKKNKSLGRIFEDFVANTLEIPLLNKSFGYSDFGNAKKNESTDASKDKNGLKISDYIPSAFCRLRNQLLKAHVHDENAASLGGSTGHAGLFGTGQDLVIYLKYLLSERTGQLLVRENMKFLSPGNDSLCGWRQPNYQVNITEDINGSGGSDQSSAIPPFLCAGHLGFTGTAFWIDQSASFYAILLTNRVISGRSAPWNHQFRSDSYRIMSDALQEKYL